ncbi:RluA family pseudouridine synthase [Salibacterium sp. K-3]
MEGFHKLEWSVPREAAGRQVKAFLKQDKKMSGSTWKAVNREGRLTKNDHPVSGKDQVQNGDVIQVYLPQASFPEGIPPARIPLDILFEDEHLLVINKPPFLPTLPGRGMETNTLAGAVRFYYEKQDIQASFHAVSRLDRETSGIVTIAKHRYAHQRLAGFFETYPGMKKYIGIAEGCWYPSEGLIDAPIDRRPDSIVKQQVTTHGKRAKTGFHVMDRRNGRSIVRYTLFTGRTHQIRVHSAYAGHPVLGDDLYGTKTEELQRQALHAERLRFIHPVKETWQSFQAPMPEDMQHLL